MKIVLINTPYLSTYGKMRIGANNSFPLGLGYIASFVRQNGYEVRLSDPEAEGISINDLYDQLEKYEPDLIGVSSVSANYPNVLVIVDEIRKRGIKAKILYGGVHVSAIPEKVMSDSPGVDIAVIGEGEHAVLEILRNMGNGEPKLSEINGICYRENGEILRTKRRKFHVNVDQFPYPARDLVDISNYRLHAHFDRGLKSATILTSRGCPSSCTFCANLLTMGRRFRPHSVDYIIGEIKHLINEYGIRHFHFVDDLFMADMKRAREISERIIEEKLNIKWFIFGRVDNMDWETLQIMKKAGCFYIVFGIESGNVEILKKMGKNTTLEQCKQAVDMCNKVGIHVFNCFIIGNEGETHETIQDTINFSRELKASLTSFGKMTPFVGTPIFKKYYENIIDNVDNWAEWTSFSNRFPVPPRHTVLTNSELLKYTYICYIKYYFRLSQCWRIVKMIDSPLVFWNYLKGGIAVLRQLFVWKKKSQDEKGVFE